MALFRPPETSTIEAIEDIWRAAQLIITAASVIYRVYTFLRAKIKKAGSS